MRNNFQFSIFNFQNLRRTLLCAIACAWLLVAAQVAHADCANGFCPLADVSGSSKLGQLYATQGDLSTFINGLFKFALAIGALAAVLRLAYAGYLYMGQADMWSHKGEAREIIGNVTLGLLLLLGIWLILNQINPDIVKLNALRNFTPAQQTTGGAASPTGGGAAPGLSPFEQSQTAPYAAP